MSDIHSIRGISDRNWKKLKIVSAKRGQSIGDLINQLIEERWPLKSGRPSKSHDSADKKSPRPAVQPSKIRDHYDGDDDGCYYGTNGLMNPNKMRIR